MKAFLTVLVLGLLVGCTNSDHAQQALANSGYTDIQITGYNPFSCGQDDFYSTGFSATNVNGLRVSGTVCSGLFFKNATVRF